MTTVTNITELNAAIVSAAAVASGTVTITLANDITFMGGTRLKAINLQPGVTLVIEGDGHTLSGSGVQRGFFVYAGTVEINDLAINDMLARGGNGGLNGGGGAGLGGGLFIGADVADNPGNVTLTNVTFANNKAAGGSGGSFSPQLLYAMGGSGGGGLGGNGGDGFGMIAFPVALVGGGGGGGIGSNGGAGSDGAPTDGAAGIVPGATAGGGAFGFEGSLGTNSQGGSSGGGGGGGGAIEAHGGGDYGGGGGGVGGIEAVSYSGGAGGFGGGGGGGGNRFNLFPDEDAGDGGFGGGGGGGAIGYNPNFMPEGGKGGDGGFGGGGGGAAANGGTGGFGGGDGHGEIPSETVPHAFTGGGGGLGAGGNVFVQEGAQLTIAGSASIAAGTVTGGTGGWQAGQAFGNGIYLQGNNTLTFSPTGTQTISGVIGDDQGSAFSSGYSAPVGYTQGAISVTVNGTGTLVLAGHNTYVGATTVAEGRLLVDGQILSPVTVESGGTLGGTGTIGFFFTYSEVKSGGTLAPGHDGAGVFTSGTGMELFSGATFAVELGGTGAGQFDRLVAMSGIIVDGAMLDVSLINGFTPTVGDSFLIIDNQFSFAVTGSFAGHAEGSTFNAGAARYTITYQGGDGNDVVLTALSTNSPPVAAGDAGSITEDAAPNPVTGNVLGNDSDPDGNTLTVTSAGTFNLDHGVLIVHADGSYSYTLDNSNPAVDALNNGQTLVDNFTYGISDGHGGTASGTLAITIQGRTNNFPPVVAGAVTLAAIAEDSGARLITQAQLLGNVTDADGPSLTATDLAIATGSGTLFDNNDGTWSYTPALNDDTSVSFSYQVTDGFTSVADSATLDITPVNDGPVAANTVLSAMAEDSGARLITQAQLLADVADPDGPPLTATGLAIASGAGTLVDNNNGTWSYTPAVNDGTSVTFSYQVTDGVAAPVAGSATLDITSVNDAPVVAGAVTLAAIAEDSGVRLITQAQLLGNATDVDGQPLTAANLAIATGLGSLVDNNNGTWSYTPALNDNASVSFSYQVTDGTIFVADSASLDITPVNDAPIVIGAVTLAGIAEDSGARLITQAQLLGNVTDVDGPSLTATAFAIATGSGSLVNNNNGTWSYTPAVNDDTSVSFSWLVSDGTTSVADSATLDITPVNDAPVNTMPASRSVVPNASVAISGLAVSDVDATSLTTTLHADHGTLSVGAVGGVTVVGSGSSTVTLTGSVAQINAALGANNVLYHGAFDFSGVGHLTMTSSDGSLSDTDVLNLSVFEQIAAQTFGGITRPALNLDSSGHIILDQPAADFAAAYGTKALYFGLPASTPYPPVAPPHDFHLV